MPYGKTRGCLFRCVKEIDTNVKIMETCFSLKPYTFSNDDVADQKREDPVNEVVETNLQRKKLKVTVNLYA